MLCVDVDLELSSELRRHPDGVETGDSVRAIADDNSRHVRLLFQGASVDAPLSRRDPMGHSARMTPLLTDTLCTECGLCCDGTLFADVELVGEAEVARIEIMGMDVEDESRNMGLLSQPCAALRGTRCGIYAHRPKCCRVFQCRLLQNAQRGAVTVERALEHIADARDQIRRVRETLDRLGNRDASLPIKERCAETLAAEGATTPETIKDRAELETAMATLEKTVWNTFLGSGHRRE